MDDFLNKELEKNKKYQDLIYKQLENDKKEFIKEIRTNLGDKIVVGFKQPKPKVNFWGKLKKIFS
jgi:hypothetical protein